MAGAEFKWEPPGGGWEPREPRGVGARVGQPRMGWPVDRGAAAGGSRAGAEISIKRGVLVSPARLVPKRETVSKQPRSIIVSHGLARNAANVPA